MSEKQTFEDNLQCILFEATVHKGVLTEGHW